MNKIRVQITVTEKHFNKSVTAIEQGKFLSFEYNCNCPVALALKERIPDKFYSVTQNMIYLKDKDNIRYATIMPSELIRFVHKFDTDRENAKVLLPLRVRMRLNYSE